MTTTTVIKTLSRERLARLIEPAHWANASTICEFFYQNRGADTHQEIYMEMWREGIRSGLEAKNWLINEDSYQGSRLRSSLEAADRILAETTSAPASDLSPVGGSDRDIYEVANQLGGYVDPSTPKRLATFLIREAEEATKLADEVVRLRAERLAEQPLDWLRIAKAAGRYNIRYATNAELEAFLKEIAAGDDVQEVYSVD